jgi:hypothetical protein
MSRTVKQLEHKIKGKLNAIERGDVSVQEAGVNTLLTRLKTYDEASHEELQQKYIEVVKSLKKD